MTRNRLTNSRDADLGTATLAPDETASPYAGAPHLETQRLFGMDIHDVTLAGVLDAVRHRIQSRNPGYIVTPNVDHVCRFANDHELRQAYRNSFLVLPDGVPIMWASRLLGKPLQQKLSGSDLVWWLSEFAARHGYSVFLFGAAEGVAEEAAAKLRTRYPELKVGGTFSPPMGFERDPGTIRECLRRIREAAPDLCFVALGSPKQEIWLNHFSRESGVPVMVGVGAGLDFVSGRSRRAPVLVQKIGLEWAWRLAHEPRRLAKRYLIDDSTFFVLLWRELRKRGREQTL